MENIQAAVIQMVSGTDVSANIDTMQHRVEEAARQGAEWIVLPEYWPIMGQRDTDKLKYAETLGDGRLQNIMSSLAAKLDIVLFGGTIPLRSCEPDKVLNTQLVYGRQGQLLGHYDKMHLFGYHGLGERYAEADTIIPGQSVPQLQVDNTSVAQAICYDLRFPEFFRAQLPFEVLVLPAAFTYTTGKAHWQTLLCARAIENQCFVLAAAQGGWHQNGRQTFGHSMIINPWGEIMACLPEGEGVVMVELNADMLASVRRKLPALKHRIL
ncbi:carbon-nitrogen hydrolase family protein [Neisseriaceae bacterium ESL0693]|nr:carbon-nitrogen hydrolase family protein [Neisseriaceae bacterium ESL0693]